MNLILRVDVSNHIGTGHITRCLTLAEELCKLDSHVKFICRAHPGHMAEKVTKQGFQLSLLPEAGQATETKAHEEDYAAWLGVTQDQDAKETIAALRSERPDWLIVDHYSLDVQWEKSLRPYAHNIMVIDDLANREHDCDLLLDQNYFQEPTQRYKGLLPEHCLTLLGPKYALLRREIRQAKQFARMRDNGITRVLIYFGGSDPDNMTGMALEALDCPDLSHLLVDVVVGPNNPHMEQLKEQASNRSQTRLHIQPEGFTELMLRADICIGAGGTTTWERLCLNLPSLVVTVAANQEELTKELDSAGFVKCIGKNENTTSYDIQKNLIQEIQKLENRECHSIMPNPVDGLGTLRVAEAIIPSSSEELSLRRATIDDMELYYFWANAPVVRENSFQQEPIPWKSHVSWFTKKFESSDTEMWVMQTSQGLAVGQVRFDKNEKVININYSLDFIARGRGWGKKLLEMGISKLYKSRSDIVIQGQVKKANPASRKIFLKLGFNETIENDVSTFTKNIHND